MSPFSSGGEVEVNPVGFGWLAPCVCVSLRRLSLWQQKNTVRPHIRGAAACVSVSVVGNEGTFSASVSA